MQMAAASTNTLLPAHIKAGAIHGKHITSFKDSRHKRSKTLPLHLVYKCKWSRCPMLLLPALFNIEVAPNCIRAQHALMPLIHSFGSPALNAGWSDNLLMTCLHALEGILSGCPTDLKITSY